MQAWSQTFEQLKEQYVRRSAERVGKIVEMLALLVQDPTSSDVISQLVRHFHWLAGSGTMYGFPQVSSLGAEGEDYCNTLLRDPTKKAPADVNKLKTILNELSAQFKPEVSSATAETTTLSSERLSRDNDSDKPDIVIIDEDQTDLTALTRQVEDAGMSVRTARSMTSGIAELGKQLPHGLIVQIPLPDGDAYELVEHVRSLQGGEDLAVIIVSKQTGFLDKVRSIHCGADSHFEKPVDVKLLMRRLRYLMEKHRQDSMRILSVEDDPDQAAFIRAFLESAGYQVRTCTDPKNFDAYLSAFNPDLVLLDVMLPGMTGYELARYLRQDERHATLPVIFLTTHGNIEARIEAARSGGDDHLVKPVPLRSCCPQYLLVSSVHVF